MSVAAILLCTTLVTNVGNTSVATRDCREVAPPMVMKAPVQNTTVAYMQPPVATNNQTVVARWTEKSATEVQSANSVELQAMLPVNGTVSPTEASKPAIAKPVKPYRMKAAKQSQNRKLRKTPRRVKETREANRISRPAIQHRPAKKLSAWEKLQGMLIGRPRT